jgi:hypothetical protein
MHKESFEFERPAARVDNDSMKTYQAKLTYHTESGAGLYRATVTEGLAPCAFCITDDFFDSDRAIEELREQMLAQGQFGIIKINVLNLDDPRTISVLPTTHVHFGIADKYGRDCGCWYVPNLAHNGDGWYIRFQPTRNGADYQKVSCSGEFTTFEAAKAKGPDMADSYRRRCAKQFGE